MKLLVTVRAGVPYVNGGVATIKCTTPAGLREGKGR